MQSIIKRWTQRGDSTRRAMTLSLLGRVGIGLLATLFLLFLSVPLVSLFFHDPLSELWQDIVQPETLQALQLSIVTTCISTVVAIVFGLPVAYILVRVRFPGRQLVETLVTLPTVLPPVVAGVALLLTFGRLGLLGQYLNAYGIVIPFTTAAVVMAQTFVSAPFFVNSARAGLEQFDQRYEAAALPCVHRPGIHFVASCCL